MARKCDVFDDIVIVIVVTSFLIIQKRKKYEGFLDLWIIV